MLGHPVLLLKNLIFLQECLKPEQPSGPLPTQALDVRVARGCGDIKGNKLK